MTAQPLLSARSLTVEKQGRALLGLPALDVSQGEVVALFGPNGAGKSTLLLCLAGLLRPTTGLISFRGEPLRDLLAYRRRIAMVFQEPLLLSASVFDNVAAGLRLRGLPRREVAERVRESLARLRIEHLEARDARTLSGGEAQRTSLARAFAVHPEVLFLDEPFAALDAPTREALWEDFIKTLRQSGVTALIATHDRNEALSVADRMLLLKEGQIIQDGAPEEVMNRPADEWTAQFVGMETLVSGRVAQARDGVLTVEAGGMLLHAVGQAQPGDAVLLVFRPEHVTLLRTDPVQGTSARNHFPCRVTGVTRQGFLEKVTLDAGFPLAALVSRPSLEELEIAPGAQLVASVKATAIHVLRKG